MINMTPAELQACIDKAAERGATRALEKVGLHDQYAGDDIRDLRALMRTWRVAKKTALKSAIQNITNFIFMLLMAGLALKFGIRFLEK